MGRPCAGINEIRDEGGPGLATLLLIAVVAVVLLIRHEPFSGQNAQAARTSAAGARTATASAPGSAAAPSPPAGLAAFYVATWSGSVSEPSGTAYTMTVCSPPAGSANGWPAPATRR